MQYVGTTFSLILGQLVKVLRDSKTPQMTQSDIAKILDTSVMSVSRLEKGTSDLSVAELERLSEFFQVPADKLIKISIEVKSLLIAQKCIVLQDKHQLKKMKEFKKLDRNIVYELCKKVATTTL
ncbi:MAG: hypothetical protein CMP22_04705 [Rickettsiales bacterium]|nr:hypothetical protein [Rickettsiales bacterium]|tara:strand:+ start:1283 stop:1654 length:372 start_codon:yes stop_codon:yes gene_type:complete